MKTSYFIIACTVGIFTYLLNFGIMGENGLLSLKQKQEYLHNLRSHLIELEYLQTSLANRVLAMESSQERIGQEMNRLGFIQEHQTIIRLPNAQPIPRRLSPGTRISLPPFESPTRGILISIGLAAGMVTFLFLVLGDVLLSKKASPAPHKVSQEIQPGEGPPSHNQEHILASNS